MLIDTHAHLDFPDFANDLEDVLRRAEEVDVRRVITIGTSIESSRRAIELAENYPSVYAAIGVHPSHAEEAEDDVITPLRDLAKNPRVVAIGETGLDYHHLASEKVAREEQVQVMSALRSETDEEIEAQIRDGAYKSKQASLFQQQLDLAVELGLNVVIHQRDAWEDTLEIVRPVQRAKCAVSSIASVARSIRPMKFLNWTASFRSRELSLSKTAQPYDRSRQKSRSGNLCSKPIARISRQRPFEESAANRRMQASLPKRSRRHEACH